MIKYFCDKCQKEVDRADLNPVEKAGGTLTTIEIGNICDDCLEKLRKWINKDK